MLDVELVDGGGSIRRLLGPKGLTAIGPGDTVEFPRPVEDAYAAIPDFVYDWIDAMDEARRAEMLTYGDQIDELIAPMRAAWSCLITASREVNLTSGAGQGACRVAGSDCADCQPSTSERSAAYQPTATSLFRGNGGAEGRKVRPSSVSSRLASR